MPFAGHTTDGLHDPLRWRFRMHGFLSHLHSLMVTMSQKSFVPQAAKSVSQELMSDTAYLPLPCAYGVVRSVLVDASAEAGRAELKRHCLRRPVCHRSDIAAF